MRRLAVATFGALTFGALTFGALTFGALTLGALTFGALIFGVLTLGALNMVTISHGTKEPIQLLGLKWFVLIMDKHLKIGCELHSFDDWTLEGIEIAEKHQEAEWWNKHKDMIFKIIETTR